MKKKAPANSKPKRPDATAARRAAAASAKPAGSPFPAACTIIARNYLPHALTLAESYIKHHPGADFYLLVVDGSTPQMQISPGIKLVEPHQLAISYFTEICFKYDVTELSTAVKPTLLALLLRDHPQVIYFDPDILVMRPLDELLALLNTTSIVLTPHLLEPIPLDGKRPDETDILIAGAYNLGFIAISQSEQTARFLTWWEQRLRDHCMVDTRRGLMTDQKWIDLIPSLFEQTRILRDDTYNAAYWNLHSRPISRDGPAFLTNGRALGFFHFSGFNPLRRRVLSKHQDRTQVVPGTPLADLLDHYGDQLLHHGFDSARKWEYGHGRFDNGVRIHRLARWMYRDLPPAEKAVFGDPFKTAAPRSFYRWITTPAGPAALSPFLQRVYQDRVDLPTAFPDVNDRHREAFVEWATATGPVEMDYDQQLAAPAAAGPATLVVQADGDAPVIAGINVCGYLRTESGLGGAARGYIAAIQQAGLALALKDISDSALSRSQDRTHETDHDDHPWPVNLICINPEQHFKALPAIGESFFKDRFNIGVWAWELPDFPDKWQDRFHYFDEIWVGSRFVADALAKKSPVPVVCLPPVLGNPRPGSREQGRRLLGAGEGCFVLLFIFDFHSYFERKNPLGLIAAFKAAFGTDRSVRLVIKCVNEDFKPGLFQQMLQRSTGSSIQIINGYWTDQQMCDLTEACDAYVSLHRAEGTGLTIADAMARGKPVIATDWSGNTDFMSASNSFPVRCTLVQLAENIGPYRIGQTWAEPSIDHAIELFRQVRAHPDRARARGDQARADLQARYGAPAIAALIRQRLTVIAKRPGFISTRDALHSGELVHKHLTYDQQVLRVRELVQQIVPVDAHVTIISKGDHKLMNIASRCTSHFPQENGQYAGHHPADSSAAVNHLLQSQQAGAGYLVIPSSAFWWLTFYTEFQSHLQQHAVLLHEDEDAMIYQLTPAAPEAADTSTAVTTEPVAVDSSPSAAMASPDAPAHSLEQKLVDVQESLWAHAQRVAGESQQLRSDVGLLQQQLAELSAQLADKLISQVQHHARLNESATLIEAHARQMDRLAVEVTESARQTAAAVAAQDKRLLEFSRTVNLRINELSSSMAALEARGLATPTDHAAMTSLYPPLPEFPTSGRPSTAGVSTPTGADQP